MLFIDKRYNQNILESYILGITILLFLFRTAMPVLKYPFLFIYAGTVLYTLIKYRAKLFVSAGVFFRVFRLAIGLVFILLLFFILSDKQYLTVFKDVMNSFILLSLFFIMTILINTKSEFDTFINNLFKLIIFFALLISINDFCDFVGFFPDNSIFTTNDSTSIHADSIHIDYNFALLPILFGMIAVFYYLLEAKTKSPKYGYNILLIIFSMSILFSGSRRGLIVFGILIMILLGAQILLIFKKDTILRKLGTSTSAYLLSFLLFLLLIFISVTFTSYSFKNKALELLGTKDILTKKKEITSRIFRYYTVINKNQSYSDLYGILWTPVFTPKDPDSGWGSNKHKTIFPLTGKNVEIVPSGSKGYLLDSTCTGSLWGGNFFSWTMIKDCKVSIGDSVKASVYCYISPDFDGDFVRLSIEGSSLGKREDYFNLTDKGSWQKLELNVRCKDGKAPVYMFFCKYNATDFSKLKGNVIFAYPSVEVIENVDSTYINEGLINPIFNPYDPNSGWGSNKHKTIFPLTGDNVGMVPPGAKGYLMDSTCNGTLWGENFFSHTLLNSFQVNNGDSVTASVFCYVSKEFDGDFVRLSTEGSTGGKREDYYNLEKRGTWQKLDLNVKCDEGEAPVYLYFCKFKVTDFSSLKGYVIFSYPQINIVKQKTVISINNKDNLNRVGSEGMEPLKSYNEIYKNLAESTFLSDKYHKINSIARISNTGLQKINFEADSKNLSSKKSAGLLFSISMLMTFIQPTNDPDLIRKWASKYISEDTVYHGYSKKLFVDTIPDKLTGDRLMRWKFAFQIISKEYNYRQIIFGGGFNFLNWYGYYFYGNKTRSDYPHNPFLSVLLYSGILGLLVYIIFIFRVFSIYAKSYKNYTILTLYFIITFFFSFFSAGSPLDPPVMGFFVLLSFFIKYINEISHSS